MNVAFNPLTGEFEVRPRAQAAAAPQEQDRVIIDGGNAETQEDDFVLRFDFGSSASDTGA